MQGADAHLFIERSSVVPHHITPSWPQAHGTVESSMHGITHHAGAEPAPVILRICSRAEGEVVPL